MISKLGRTKGHRAQVIANLATSLVLHERITTTLAKAKTVLPTIDKMFTTAKKDNLLARRSLNNILNDRKAVAKVFTAGLPNIKNISSGFASVYKIAPRKGDGAPMAIVQLNENIFKKPEVKSKAEDTNKKKVVK